MLLSRQQQPHDLRGDDRGRVTRARQAAEALFSSKPPVSTPSDIPLADQTARRPRVVDALPIAPLRCPPAPVRPDRRETLVSSEPQMTRAIQRAQFPRIRALVKYGMSVAETTEVYGVAAGEIEGILRHD
jgi:uncharacterized protein YfaA (DUF2138 family)